MMEKIKVDRCNFRGQISESKHEEFHFSRNDGFVSSVCWHWVLLKKPQTTLKFFFDLGYEVVLDEYDVGNLINFHTFQAHNTRVIFTIWANSVPNHHDACRVLFLGNNNSDLNWLLCIYQWLCHCTCLVLAKLWTSSHQIRK